jgi:hypothetical protein
MATPTNAVSTLNSVGIREDLENVIYKVAPTETPFLSSLDNVKSPGNYHEWQTSGLRAPNPNPTQYDGADAVIEPGNLTSRMGNYVQHFEDAVQVTGRAEAVVMAGRSDEMNRQIVDAGLAQKRDIETRFLGNYASAAETPGTTPYACGGALAWLQTNTQRGTAGASGGFANGIVSAATNASSTRAFTETMLKTAMNQVFTSTGTMKSRAAYMSPAIKQEAAAFTGLALNRRETGNKKAVIIGGADIYVSDFGEVEFVPSIFCSPRDVLITDPDMWAKGTLRGMVTQDLAKTGDSEKKLILSDVTLICRNEKASAVIADVQ